MQVTIIDGDHEQTVTMGSLEVKFPTFTIRAVQDEKAT